ncbi:ribonuclease III domain-containing protein [Peziza echinospora]|nr:ribonuclease III domain-containing protein [Peziza echinospora]
MLNLLRTRPSAGTKASLLLRRTYATPTTTTTTAAAANSKQLDYPPSRLPRKSAKLAALHSRLSLHPSFPLETLARCLIHPTASPVPATNNSGLSNLGNNILGYYASEYLLTTYPRLPMNVLRAAMWAYISPDALASVARGWGIENAFEPTLEVDPGLLQFKRLPPGYKWGPDLHEEATQIYHQEQAQRASTDPSSTTATESSGDTISPPAYRSRDDILLTLQNQYTTGIPLSFALSTAVKSIFAAIHIHESPAASHQFFRAHITSRNLNIHKLFQFDQPTRQLSRLCAREGFAPPVARLLSETGRRSRTPVFVVGVYSGEERLGEGYGPSLDEARIRAAVAALRAWYLYSPPKGLEGEGAGAGKGDLPSLMEQGAAGLPRGREFRGSYVDVGEVIV